MLTRIFKHSWFLPAEALFPDSKRTWRPHPMKANMITQSRVVCENKTTRSLLTHPPTEKALSSIRLGDFNWKRKHKFSGNRQIIAVSLHVQTLSKNIRDFRINFRRTAPASGYLQPQKCCLRMTQDKMVVSRANCPTRRAPPMRLSMTNCNSNIAKNVIFYASGRRYWKLLLILFLSVSAFCTERLYMIFFRERWEKRRKFSAH